MNRFLLVACLAGCGPSERNFQDDYKQLACKCADTPDLQEYCDLYMDAVLGGINGSGTCDYDASAAKECLETLDAYGCKFEEEVGPEMLCDDVYVGACEVGTD